MLELERFLELSERYKDLGWAVQEQLAAVLRGEAMEEQNSNALKMIASFLWDASEIIDGAEDMACEIDEYLAQPLPEYAL